MAAKKIEIIYDINGKPVDVAIDKTINLQKQLRLLTAELRRTKEGTAEFAVLSNKANDVKDNLDRVNAKSKDFFATLSLLPGPIGSFAGQIDNAIGLLKTFSGFSLKDISNQFKQLGGDIKDIAKNFLGLKDESEKTSEAFKNTTTNATVASKSISDLGETTKNAGRANMDFAKTASYYEEMVGKNVTVTNRLVAGQRVYTVSVEEANGSVTKLTQSEVENAVATDMAAKAQQNATFKTQLLTNATKAATIAWNALKIALGGVVIGLAIAGLMKLYEVLKEWITGAKAAAAENERLTKSFEALKKGISETQQAIKEQTDISVLEAKAAGKSQEEIYKITKKGWEDRVKANEAGRKRLEKEIESLMVNTILNEEDRNARIKDVEAEYVKLGDQAINLRVEGRKLELEETVRIAEKGREANKKALEKQIEDTKSAYEQLRTLRNENILSSIQDERFKQRSELEFQRDGEQRKIEELKISEELKGKLKEQINTKYDLKLKQLNKKFAEEDAKAAEEFNIKLGEISIAAIKDETERQVAAREEKYKNDLRALERDINFIKMSEEAKNFYRKELLLAAEQDKRKIENDGLIKRLDNELKFLQIRNEAIRKGTAAFFDSQRELLDKAQERELAELDLTEKQKTAIKEKYARMRKDIDRQEFETYLQYVNQGLSTLSGFFQQQQQIVALQQQNEIATLQNTVANKEELAAQEDKVKEKYFYKNRNAQYAQALIGSFQSAISAYSSLAAIPVVGPALGAAAAAVALAFGFKQANLIKKQQYVSAYTMPSEQMNQGQNRPLMPNYLRNYEEGGLIGGRRHAEGGTLIEAEKGEAIMTRGAVTMFAPLLSMMNQMGGGTSFTIGAAGQARPDAPKITTPSIIQATPVVKTYVVSNELTTEVEKQARLKDLSTL